MWVTAVTLFHESLSSEWCWKNADRQTRDNSCHHILISCMCLFWKQRLNIVMIF